LGGDFEFGAVSLDLDLLTEVTGLAVHLHTLEHEGLEVGHIEDLIVCRCGAVDGELLGFGLLGNFGHVQSRCLLHRSGGRGGVKRSGGRRRRGRRVSKWNKQEQRGMQMWPPERAAASKT
jgi:hypothetical protein